MQQIHAYTNGAAAHQRVVQAHAPGRDPYEHLLDGGRNATLVAMCALLGALLLHGAAAARTALIDPVLLDWSRRTGEVIEKRLSAAIDVSFNKEPPPPPPPAEETKEEEKPTEDTPPPVVKQDNPYDDVKPTQAANPAAEAGQILGNNDEVDFTGDAFITGSGAAYAGGSTSSYGTNTKPVRTNANGSGNGPADAPPRVQPGPDRSRPISLSGSSDWKCPWPAEADAEQIDEAYVTIEVSVGPDGHAQRVTVLQDPGYGFAREAKSCAMRQSYNPALDHDGRPIAASKKYRVRFER